MPIPAEHREFLVKIDGFEVPRRQHLLSLSINTTINRIATARLVYQDGSSSASDFPLSNSDLFVPGAEVEILAGSTREPIVLFKGLIDRHELKVRTNSAAQLILTCKHKAIKMTVGRKSAYFSDQTDSDIMSALFEAAGITADVTSSPVRHKQLVQYHATDWDFCLMRAQANGLSLLTKEDEIVVKPPKINDASKITLQYGATILEIDLQLDSRHQYSAIKATSWDIANQELIEKDGTDPVITSPGNVDSGLLASVIGLDSYQLIHPQANEEELQSWADAQWVYSQANRINGRIKCEGIGTINVGDTITLSGVGERFNGDAYVSAVRHDFDLVQGWKSNFQIGGIKTLDESAEDITAPRSSGLLPSINGLQIGIVVDNEDPDAEYRIRVKMPLADNEDEGTWARVSCLDAGEERGFFIRPEIGDEVVLGFLNDDPRQAIILGMLNSSAKAAPLEGSNDNHEKVFQTRSQMKLSFNDESIVLKLETPAGNNISLSEEDEAITIADQHGNLINMNVDGIAIESAAALTLTAATDITIESGASLAIKGGAELKMEGTAGAELSSSANTKVSGSLVQIN